MKEHRVKQQTNKQTCVSIKKKKKEMIKQAEKKADAIFNKGNLLTSKQLIIIECRKEFRNDLTYTHLYDR